MHQEIYDNINLNSKKVGKLLTLQHFPQPAHTLACQRTRYTWSRLPYTETLYSFVHKVKKIVHMAEKKNLFPALVKPGGSLVLGSVWKYLEKCLHKNFIALTPNLLKCCLHLTSRHSVTSSPLDCHHQDLHSRGIDI